MKTIRKRDIYLILAILGIAAATFAYGHFSHRPPAVTAQIQVDGTVVKTLDLSQDTEITVSSANGGYNRLVVKGGEIWCSEASCPDKICVHQGRKHLSSDTIVCLPNQMIITITGEE